MNTALKIFLRAHIIYAILSLWCGPLWVLAEMTAIPCSLVGLVVFLPAVPGLRGLRISTKPGAVILTALVALVAAFLATWAACAWWAESHQSALEAMLEMWMFPATGWVSAVAATLSYHRSVAAAVCAAPEDHTSTTFQTPAV